jgi:hypothetical protein
MNELSKLFVVIGAKTTDFEKGIEKTKSQLNQLGITMVAIGAAITATLTAITVKWASAGDEIAKLAEKTGFTTESLSELKYAAQLSGSSLSGLETGIKRMQYAITQAGYGLMTYTRVFAQLGLSYAQLKELAPEEQFATITNAIADISDPTEKAAVALEIFGRAGTDMLPMLADGSAGLETMRKEARDLGIIFDEKAAKAAEALKDSFTKLKASISGATMAIAETLAPVVMNLASAVTSMIEKIKDWTQAHPVLTKAITNAALAIGIFCTIMGTALLVVPRLTRLLPFLGMAFQGSLGPIGWVSLAISGLIAAGTLLIGNWDKITAFFAGPAYRATQKLNGAVKDLASTMLSEMSDATQQVKDDWQSLIDFFQTGQYKNAGFLSDEQLAKIRQVNPELAAQLESLQKQAEAQDELIAGLDREKRIAREAEIATELSAIQKKLAQRWPKLSDADRTELLNQQRDLDTELANLQKEDYTTAYQNLLDASKDSLVTALQDQQNEWTNYFKQINDGWDGTLTYLQSTIIPAYNKLVTEGFLSPTAAQDLIDKFNEALKEYKSIVGQTPTYPAGVSGHGTTPANIPILSPDEIAKLLKSIPGGQRGGIVLNQTLMRVAEAGPEAIFPLDKLNLAGAGGTQEIHIHVGTLIGDDMSMRKLAKTIKQTIGEDNRRNSFNQIQRGYFTGTSGI